MLYRCIISLPSELILTTVIPLNAKKWYLLSPQNPNPISMPQNTILKTQSTNIIFKSLQISKIRVNTPNEVSMDNILSQGLGSEQEISTKLQDIKECVDSVLIKTMANLPKM